MENVVLIGMPGAGKSTIGVILAKALGMSFIDTDLLIQNNEGKLLQDIINKDGIRRFLEIEENTILSIQFMNTIIATGGSVIYSDKVMEYLKQGGLIIYLRVAYNEISKRIKNISTRGIVLEKGQCLLDIYKQRVPLYEKYSDITIDCFNKDAERIIKNIIDKIKY